MSYDVYPIQAFGMGDIIFAQTLVRRIAQGRNIVWGVWPEYIWQLKRAYPDIEWVNWKDLDINYNCQEDVILDDKRLLPIRWSAEYMGVPYANVMSSKYGMYGMDFKEWKQEAMWVRDMKKERQLCKELGVSVKDEFTLICPNFSNGSISVPVNGIVMRNIDGYSMFDWAGVILRAKGIHAVSTATLFMFQLLGIMGKVTLYPRLPAEKTLKNIEELL